MGKNCRNCGAPLDSRGNCEYCGTRAQRGMRSGIEITATSIRMWADGPNDDREEDENKRMWADGPNDDREEDENKQ